ncbi:MAG: LysR family transcriptional regulator [Lachnospiraceae bacterium]|nr:LysR family transcriptional regulator [Lachnospiraceae bacterium]
MTIRHLKIFIGVAESGSMSATANKYYISQPTVSQTIRELEKHYDVTLFDRLSKRLYITTEGEELLEYAKQIVARFNQMEEKMRKDNGRETLRVGGTMTIGTSLLPHVIQDFTRVLPQIETYTYIGNTQQIEMKLLKSKLDVGIIEGEIQNRDLICEPLISDRLVLVCNRRHEFAGQKKISVHDLQNQKFVMREEGSGTRALFDLFLKKHSIQIDIRWEVNCPAMIRQVAIENDLLAVISARSVENEIASGELRAFQVSTEEWNRSFKMVYHKDRKITDTMKELRQVVKTYENPLGLQKIQMGILDSMQ